MSRESVPDRLNRARAKRRGVSLSFDDVADLVDQMAVLANFYMAFNDSAIQLTITPECLVAAVIDTLAADREDDGTSICRTGSWWTISNLSGATEVTDPDPVAAISLYRERIGAGDIGDVKIVIPGPTIREQLIKINAA